MQLPVKPLTLVTIGTVSLAIAVGVYALLGWLMPTWNAASQPQPSSAATAAPIVANPLAQMTPTIAPTPTSATQPARDTLPRYVVNASPIDVPADLPKIAIVIDDMGGVASLSEQALNLPAGVTLSFLPYGDSTLTQAFKARVLGHEVMIHLPMEPQPRTEEPPANPGPDALYVTDTPADIARKLNTNFKFLAAMSVGVNNHMGSRFTENVAGMRQVLERVQEERMFFLDSLTTAHSGVTTAATGLTLPILVRNIFLDHYLEQAQVEAQLAQVEEHARTHGQVIAIGHPHPVTVKALQEWAPTLAAKGLALAPISHLLPKNDE